MPNVFPESTLTFRYKDAPSGDSVGFLLVSFQQMIEDASVVVTDLRIFFPFV